MTAEIYWIDLATRGRLAIVGRPRAGDWLADEIADWKASGLTDIVSLLEASEVREIGLLQEAQWCARAGLGFEIFPIPDRSVPASIPAARALWAGLAEKVRGGQAVGIHIRASIGRGGFDGGGCSGTVGHSAQGGVAADVGYARPPVPDTEGQRQWLATVFQHAIE